VPLEHAAARQAGGVATRDTQPLHSTTSIPCRPRASFHCSDLSETRQKYRARQVLRILSESGRSGARIPLNNPKTILAHLKTLKAHAGISDSHKPCPQRGLVCTGLPYHVGRRPPPSIEQQGPGASARGLDDAGRSAIGRIGRLQNGSGT
jgi:hypothetical protein